MKFNFNTTALGLDGETPLQDPTGPINLGKFAAQALTVSIEKKDIYKRYQWAQDLWRGELDLDREGQKEFRNFFEELEGISLNLRMAILEVLDKREAELKAESKAIIYPSESQPEQI